MYLMCSGKWNSILLYWNWNKINSNARTQHVYSLACLIYKYIKAHWNESFFSQEEYGKRSHHKTNRCQYFRHKYSIFYPLSCCHMFTLSSCHTFVMILSIKTSWFCEIIIITFIVYQLISWIQFKCLLSRDLDNGYGSFIIFKDQNIC